MLRIVDEALTFDDVLLLPAYSEVLPKMVDLKTRLTRGIELNLPIVSAAMDTVTESQMAITIAQLGGMGILHKNMDIDLQAMQVRRVKNLKPVRLLILSAYHPIPVLANCFVSPRKQNQRCACGRR